MVEHGKTGWLCDHERDFIYYASKMAYEPNLRSDMAHAARERGLELGGLEASVASWEEVFGRGGKTAGLEMGENHEKRKQILS